MNLYIIDQVTDMPDLNRAAHEGTSANLDESGHEVLSGSKKGHG